MLTSDFKARVVAVVAVAFAAATGLYAWAGAEGDNDVLDLRGGHPVDVARGDTTGTSGPADSAAYDLFSWLSFVALNSSPNGEVLGENRDNDTLWSTWMEDFQVLVSDGQALPPWGAPIQLPAACQALSDTSGLSRVITHTAKMDGVVGLFNQAQAGPLIDRNGNYVRYEILINEPMYGYIRNNRLYNQAGLNAFGRIDFPAGSLETEEIGAIMVKAAWKA